MNFEEDKIYINGTYMMRIHYIGTAQHTLHIHIDMTILCALNHTQAFFSEVDERLVFFFISAPLLGPHSCDRKETTFSLHSICMILVDFILAFHSPRARNPQAYCICSG